MVGKLEEWQADRQAGRHRQTDKWIDRQTDGLVDRWLSTWIDR